MENVEKQAAIFRRFPQPLLLLTNKDEKQRPKKPKTIVYTKSLTIPKNVMCGFNATTRTTSCWPEVKVLSGAAPQTGTQDVAWTNAIGVTPSGNNLTKGAGNNWGNGGAASMQALASGDGYVEWTASETDSHRMIGLSHGDSNQDYPISTTLSTLPLVACSTFSRME